jgi:predicted nuclease with TOPRIM domain
MALTNTDLKNIKDLVKVTIDEDETLVRKDDIKHLPTKDEFYEKMDEVVGELKAIREEFPTINHQLSDHEDRIEKIEDKLQIKASLS